MKSSVVAPKLTGIAYLVKGMKYVDYYKVLGVERNASQDEIKKAYRRLARKYHPDVSKESDAEARFKELGEAYEVLKDSEKRAAYDQLGANYKAGQDFNTQSWGDFSGGFNGGGDMGGSFADFFESIFRGGGFSGAGGFSGHQGGFRPQRGADTQAKITVSLAQVFRGEEVSVRTGKGKMLKVKIPKGVKEGQKIRLAGQGQPGSGGAPDGDLLIEVHIRAEPGYTLNGNNVEYVLPITPWEAALGATVTVPTLNGRVQLKIPPGSDTGKRMRLKGRGLPGKQPGDFLVKLEIHTPPPKNGEQEALYEQMRATFSYDPRAENA